MARDLSQVQRYTLELPGGDIVTVTATPEILATVKRVRSAIETGNRPLDADMAKLFLYLSEDT